MNEQPTAAPPASGLTYHLRNKPMQRRVVEAAIGAVQDVNAKKRKIKVPNPMPRTPRPVPAAPPRPVPAPAPAPPPAPPPSTTSLDYVLSEIDKAAAYGTLPAEAPRRIRAKIAAVQKEGGFAGSAFKRLGIGKRLSEQEFTNMATAGSQLNTAEAKALHAALERGGHRRVLVDHDKAQAEIDWASQYSEAATKQRAPRGKKQQTQHDIGAFQRHLTETGKRTDPSLGRRAAAVGAVGAGALVLDATHNAISNHRSFNQMMEGDPELRKMDRSKVKAKFQTMTRFAPDMAKDPFVAASTVKKLIEFDTIDPQTVKNLQENQRSSRSPVTRLVQIAGQAAGLNVV